MTLFTKQCIVSVIATLAFIALMGITGTFEYAEQICYTMPEQVYEQITRKLGPDASQRAIAAEYLDNQEYYDNLKTW